MNIIAGVAIGITLGIFVILLYVAFRNPVMFKTGLRNIPRRRTQTALIIFGLMLATVIMTAAFGTGDTVASTATDDIYEIAGETDLLIEWDEEAFPRPEDQRVIPLAEVEALRTQFADDPDIDGFLPAIAETLPVVNVDTQLNEASATIVGFDGEQAAPFGSLRDRAGGVLLLEGNQIAINEDLAEAINGEVGHTLILLFEGEPVEVEVVAISPNGFLSGAFEIGATEVPGGAVDIGFLSRILGRSGDADVIAVTNVGGVRSGLDRSDIVEAKLSQALAGTPYRVDPLKADAIEFAKLFGSIFTTIFVVFGLFSIAAGILLIFLIFIMLAAERKPEMGMARAVGAKRRHLVESFLAEGMGYDLGAALIGVVAGIGVTFVMVALVNSFAEQGLGLQLRVTFTLRSLLVSFCIGVITTFIVIFFASVRASRLNIVAAIRDLPEPILANPEAATWRGYVRATLNAAVAGGIIIVFAFAAFRLSDFAAIFSIGLLFGLVGPWLYVLRGHNFGAPRHERIAGQGIPIWPFFLILPIPFYALALLIVRLTRDRNAQPGTWLVVLGVVFLPLGLVLVGLQNRDRVIAWGAGVAVVGLGLSALFFEWTFASDRAFFFATAVSLVFFWAALTLRYFQIAERASFTIVAAVLLIFWYLFPTDAFNFLTGELDGNIEMFFISGIVMVTAGTFLIVYNADIVLPAVAAIGQRYGRIVPAVKTAVAYPLTSRMRTGMTVMMIGLITFALIMFSTINENFDQIFFSDDARGGFDTQVLVNSNNRVDDLVAALDAEGVDTSPIESSSELRAALAFETEIEDPAELGEFKTFTVFGADATFFETTALEFKRRAAGYEDDAAVWAAVASDPALAVIPGILTSGGGGFGIDEDLLNLDLSLEDGFEPFTLTFRDPGTDARTMVTVIGQVDDPGDVFWPGIFVSRESLLAAFPDSDAQFFLLVNEGGTDQEAFAKTIEARLVQASAESLEKLLDDQRAASSGFLLLFQGFMGLGLIVGIAALGVIAFRAVVERRQQIGMLRAIGYQRSMVALSFLFESGFVAISGIGMGLVMGVSFAWVLFTSGGIDDSAEGASFVVPWVQLAVICGIAFSASMAMTYFPSRSASRIAVAEALRYE